MNLIIFLLCFSLCSSFLFFILYKIQTNQLRNASQKEIVKLNDEIQKENDRFQKAKESILKLQELKQETDDKLLKIKFEILDVDFTLKEICKFM